MSTCTGHKHTFGTEPFTGRRTLVSDVGLTDSVCHKDIENKKSLSDKRSQCITTRKVCDVMLPLLRKTMVQLPRTGIFLDEEDMDLFELDMDSTPTIGHPTCGLIMKALSLGTLFFGMISLSDEEVLFHLHPNKNAWKVKGQEIYGFNHKDIFDKAFSFYCAMPSCMYRSYFPDVVIGKEGGGPAVLPLFIRKGLVNEVPGYMRQLSLFLSMPGQGAYPLMCLPCLLLKQIHNRFTERLSFDPERPQLNPFTVVDLERESRHVSGKRKPTPAAAGITSCPGFTERYIKLCKKGHVSGWQSDLCDAKNRCYYLTKLPFEEIEIKHDKNDTYNGGYTVCWRDAKEDQ